MFLVSLPVITYLLLFKIDKLNKEHYPTIKKTTIMEKEIFEKLLKGLQKIQLESLNDRGIVMWLYLSKYAYPDEPIQATISVTLFIGGNKNQHTYDFFEEDEPKNVWNNLDDIHKRFRKRPILRDLVKELKEKIVKG